MCFGEATLVFCAWETVGLSIFVYEPNVRSAGAGMETRSPVDLTGETSVSTTDREED